MGEATECHLRNGRFCTSCGLEINEAAYFTTKRTSKLRWDRVPHMASYCPSCGCRVIKPKWLYRLESTDPDKGLWYDSRGELVWTIGEVPNCETKHLPMGYDERYRQDGRMWHSSCTRKSDLSHWYTLDAALDLISNHGFVFARYLATEYHEYEQETVFIKATCLERVEMDIREVFGGAQ